VKAAALALNVGDTAALTLSPEWLSCCNSAGSAIPLIIY
jgi:hypothetical protein